MPSNTVRYEECVLTVPFRRELLELSAIETARLALTVIEFEGPIHTEEIARRIREAFGLQKTGKRILTHVKSGLNHLSRNKSVDREKEFWSISGQTLTVVRNRRNAALSLRRATMIAPEEYRLALTTIIAEAAAISRDDLVVETARLFGFDRTGPDLKEAIDRQMERLVKEGRLHLDGSGLRLFVKADATSDKLPTKPTKLNGLAKSGASKEDGLKMWGEVKGCEQQQKTRKRTPARCVPPRKYAAPMKRRLAAA